MESAVSVKKMFTIICTSFLSAFRPALTYPESGQKWWSVLKLELSRGCGQQGVSWLYHVALLMKCFSMYVFSLAVTLRLVPISSIYTNTQWRATGAHERRRTPTLELKINKIPWGFFTSIVAVAFSSKELMQVQWKDAPQKRIGIWLSSIPKLMIVWGISNHVCLLQVLKFKVVIEIRIPIAEARSILS